MEGKLEKTGCSEETKLKESVYYQITFGSHILQEMYF